MNFHNRINNSSRKPKSQKHSKQAKQFRAKWHAVLEKALDGISDKKTDGLSQFLEEFAPKLTKKELILVRDLVISRGRASTVLRGAALKSFAGSEKQQLLLKLNELINPKQANGSEESDDTIDKKEVNKLPEEFIADELLEGIESATSLRELNRIFKTILLSNRIRKSKGGYSVTSVGQSYLDDVNREVNQEICDAYKLKLQTLKSAEKNREDLLRQQEELEEKKEAAMPGVFKEAELNGSKLRLYIGYSKKGKRVIRVDEILSGKPGLAKGATFEVGSQNMPKVLKGIDPYHLELTFEKLDIDLAATASDETLDKIQKAA